MNINLVSASAAARRPYDDTIVLNTLSSTATASGSGVAAGSGTAAGSGAAAGSTSTDNITVNVSTCVAPETYLWETRVSTATYSITTWCGSLFIEDESSVEARANHNTTLARIRAEIFTTEAKFISFLNDLPDYKTPDCSTYSDDSFCTAIGVACDFIHTIPNICTHSYEMVDSMAYEEARGELCVTCLYFCQKCMIFGLEHNMEYRVCTTTLNISEEHMSYLMYFIIKQYYGPTLFDEFISICDRHGLEYPSSYSHHN